MELTQMHVSSPSPTQFQPSVLSPISDYASFLCIHLTEWSKMTKLPQILKLCRSFHYDMVNTCHQELRTGQMEDEQVQDNGKDELILNASIAFGMEFLKLVVDDRSLLDQHIPSYQTFPNDLVGEIGSMPKTGGDIFLHVKSNRMDASFEVCNTFVKRLSNAQIQFSHSDHTMSFLYKKNQFYRNGMGRDLSQFEDGTENPGTLEGKIQVLSSPQLVPGACFLLTQRWVHSNLKWFDNLPVEQQESIIGRSKTGSVEIESSKRSPNAHISRVVITDDQEEELKIVRQSMSYGTVNEHGLFFIGFTNDLNIMSRMLYRMVGKDNISGHDAHFNDHILKFSKAVTGQYWYVPSMQELATGKFGNKECILTSKL